ncbi:LOW QUALITY PROTEIN: Crinkler (CRN) [Phytophthora megakarya]|uniref:Crinkler (CRN) n=1 Tax=Phytophthora megakarya TaxID=4795 RepID=A0A225W6R6_9STRA|nr:LOW QUALITY PROTEIN: Crinkler (CRN) [Phytophthora megakarya]
MMAKVKLLCGVYGNGSVLSVDIKRDAYVEALRKVVFDEKRYGERYKFDASELRLYLGRGNHYDLNTESFLQSGIDTEYEKMLCSWRLNDEELFGSSFSPGENEIHLLVELPDHQARVTLGELGRIDQG